MITILIFIIILGILVLVHEFGHFVTAKRAGMRVEEFGFGFPPRLWGIKKNETMYSINWIPFGGFVKITGEDGEHRDDPRSFTAKSGGWRALVLTAGVLMNILLAFVLLSIGNTVGLRVGLIDQADITKAEDVKVQIVQIVSGSPAADANLTMLDEILGFNEEDKLVAVKNIEDVQQFIASHKGQEVVMRLQSGNHRFSKNLVPRLNPPEGEGALGVTLAVTGVIKYPFYEAVYRGAKDTGIVTANTVIGYGIVIKNLFTTGKAGVDLSGPVGIAVITGQAARLGFTYLMQFTALISINLAVLNIIPFPALDGGRLLFLIIEKIKRSPISKRVEMMTNAAGFALLIMLMIYVTTKDVIKLF